MRIWDAEHLCFIHALDFMAWMGECGGESAVVGENEQPFGVEIETADRIDVLPDSLEQIEHGRTPLRIRSRRDIAARLVEEEVTV